MKKHAIFIIHWGAMPGTRRKLKINTSAFVSKGTIDNANVLKQPQTSFLMGYVQ